MLIFIVSIKEHIVALFGLLATSDCDSELSLCVLCFSVKPFLHCGPPLGLLLAWHPYNLLSAFLCDDFGYVEGLLSVVLLHK
jgi:hypothetical protein